MDKLTLLVIAFLTLLSLTEAVLQFPKIGKRTDKNKQNGIDKSSLTEGLFSETHATQSTTLNNYPRFQISPSTHPIISHTSAIHPIISHTSPTHPAFLECFRVCSKSGTVSSLCYIVIFLCYIVVICN